MGIIGLPNIGKTMTYNILSNLNIPKSNGNFSIK